jgi:UbiD family decarboxylase
MDLRAFLSELEAAGELQRVTESTSPQFEVARRVAANDGQPLLFETLPGYPAGGSPPATSPGASISRGPWAARSARSCSA